MKLEVADIFRAHEADLIASRGGISIAEERVLRAIVRCRTAALGGHVEKCDRCSHLQISYNSCRNRHCPKCQGAAREKWLAARASDLLPVEYFHVVFSIPHEIAAVALTNKKVVYEILFRATGETLREIAADPRHLGAEIGFLAVLHTWGQSLEHHPHVHCVVPGGGLSPDRTRWIPGKPAFFLPVRVLSKRFRKRFLAMLLAAYDAEKLEFSGSLAALCERDAFLSYLAPLRKKKWFVYAKPPFGGPEHVLKYLSRYTHRVAISNGRLVALEDGKVSFLWKDYAHQCKKRVMTLSAVEFLRRFLTHVLPTGFVRIRHYGFLANCRRKATISLLRELLHATKAQEEESPPSSDPGEVPKEEIRCPACKCGRMVIMMRLEAGEALPEHLSVATMDTS